MLYAVAAFYVLVGIVFFILYKKRLSRMDRTATLILITIAIMGIVIQALWSIPVELFFESIGFLGFLLLLEEKGGERVQKTGGRFNKSFIVVISLIFITVITINIIHTLLLPEFYTMLIFFSQLTKHFKRHLRVAVVYQYGLCVLDATIAIELYPLEVHQIEHQVFR